jgi:hypothetical protein
MAYETIGTTETGRPMGVVQLNIVNKEDLRAFNLAADEYLDSHPEAFVHNGVLMDTLESIAAPGAHKITDDTARRPFTPTTIRIRNRVARASAGA